MICFVPDFSPYPPGTPLWAAALPVIFGIWVVGWMFYRIWKDRRR